MENMPIKHCFYTGYQWMKEQTKILNSTAKKMKQILRKYLTNTRFFKQAKYLTNTRFFKQAILKSTDKKQELINHLTK